MNLKIKLEHPAMDGRKKEEVSGAALMARDFLAKRDEAPRVRRGGEGKSHFLIVHVNLLL